MESGGNNNRNALQLVLERVLEKAPRARDFYDKQLQRKLGTKGKPIYDIMRRPNPNPQIETRKAIAEVLHIRPQYVLEPETAASVPDNLLYLTPNEHYMLDRETAGSDARSMEKWRKIAEAAGSGRPNRAVVAHSTARDGVSDRSVQLRRFDISYAMGPGTNIDDYVEEEPFEVDAGWLSTISRSPAERLGVAQGSGDSMFPTILDSDFIIFDTTQRVLNLQDRIWVASINGAGAIKRLRPLGKGRIEVISDNPSHGNYEVDAEDVFLLGRVLASIRKH